MPDDTAPLPSDPSGARGADPAPADAVTPSGYSYEVVGDGSVAAPPAAAGEKSARAGGVPVWAFVAGLIIPAVVVGAVAWLVLGGDGDGGGGSDATTTGLLHAFTAGTDGTTTRRFEGQMPPGFPEEVPAYEGATVAGSVLQVTGDDAGYIVVASSGDERDAVAADLRERFAADPWQIDGTQDSRDQTLYQFSRIDDANTTGIVLLSASQDGAATTIITSIQVTGGAAGREPEPFTPAASRETPADFPAEIPVYDGAIVIETAFRNDAGSKSFLVSYITQDDASDVLDFYRSGLEGEGLTVEDGDTSASTLEDAQGIRFSDADLTLNGDVIVGTFGEDDGFTRIDVQAGDER